MGWISTIGEYLCRNNPTTKKREKFNDTFSSSLKQLVYSCCCLIGGFSQSSFAICQGVSASKWPKTIIVENIKPQTLSFSGQSLKNALKKKKKDCLHHGAGSPPLAPHLIQEDFLESDTDMSSAAALNPNFMSFSLLKFFFFCSIFWPKHWEDCYIRYIP